MRPGDIVRSPRERTIEVKTASDFIEALCSKLLSKITLWQACSGGGVCGCLAEVEEKEISPSGFFVLLIEVKIVGCCYNLHIHRNLPLSTLICASGSTKWIALLGEKAKLLRKHIMGPTA